MNEEQLEALLRSLLQQRDQQTDDRLRQIEETLTTLSERGAEAAEREAPEEVRREIEQESERREQREEVVRAAVSDGLGTDDADEIEGTVDLNMGVVCAGVLDGWRRNVYRDTPEYRAVMQATERAQQADVDTAGGYAVPSEFMAARFIPALEARTIAMRLGATVMDGLGGMPVEIPRQATNASAAFQGEIEDTTETSVDLGMLRMTPHLCAAYIPASRRFLRLAATGRNMIDRVLNTAIGRRIDLAIMKGDGAKGTPVGMVNSPNVNSVDWSSAAFGDASTVQDVTNLLDAMYFRIEDDDALGDRMGWAMSPAVRRKLREVKTTDGLPLLFATKMSGQTQSQLRPLQGEFYGMPYQTSTQLAGGSAGDLILADWERTLVGFFQPLLLEASEHVRFLSNQTVIKATVEVDIGVEHGESICIANSLDTAIA